jgi:hypothetical protein
MMGGGEPRLYNIVRHGIMDGGEPRPYNVVRHGIMGGGKPRPYGTSNILSPYLHLLI